MKLSEDGTKLLAVDNEDISLDGSFIFPSSVKTIGSAAFEECNKLQKITIPSQVTAIQDFAFWGCTNLKTIILHDEISKIDDCAFHSCTHLEIFNIPKNLNVINKGTFYNCTSLENIIIPETVTLIDQSAFEACKNLRAVFISQNIGSIGHGAFYDCKNLKAIFTEDSNDAIKQVKAVLPNDYELGLVKVTSIKLADKNFQTLYENQSGKKSQNTLPVSDENKKLVQINNVSSMDQTSFLDEHHKNLLNS